MAVSKTIQKHIMRNIALLICFYVLPLFSFSQNDSLPENFNFGFETVNPGTNLPLSWTTCENNYRVAIDTTEKHSGNNSVLIELSNVKSGNAVGCIA
jgi:hypothetical protein